MTDFSTYEYQEKLKQMTELLKNKEGWGDAYDSSMGQTLIQMVVDATDSLHYMLERRSVETFLDHSKLQSSTIARANELGYRPRLANFNSGMIKIVIPTPQTEPLIIPALSKFKNINNNRTYVLLNDAIIQIGETEVESRVIEGDVSIEEMTPNDAGYVTLQNYDNIDHRIFVVSDSNQEIFRDVRLTNDGFSALSFLSEDDAFFDLRYATEGLRIVFGDGVNGKFPSGAIQIISIRNDDPNDPIVRLNTEFEYTGTPFLDELGDEIEITASNVTQVTGYRPIETTDSIKKNAVDYHKTNFRAVTNRDYGYWARASGLAGIVDARAYGEEETRGFGLTANNVYITYLKADGTDMTVSEQQEIREYMDRFKTSQAHLVFRNAETLNLVVNVRIRKNKQNPSANESIYGTVREFLIRETEANRVGGSVFGSELIRDMYRLRTVRDGVEYPLLDHVDLDVIGAYSFTYPSRSNKVFVSLDEEDLVPGTFWAIHFGDVPCVVPITSTDTHATLYAKMRNEIIEQVGLSARVVVRDLITNDSCIPEPIPMDGDVGSRMLVGLDAMAKNRQLVDQGFVGAAKVKVRQVSKDAYVSHYYYSSKQGLRPPIPLRIDSTLDFVAPSDTRVLVWTMTDADQPETRKLYRILERGDTFEFRSSFEHIIQFEYENDSYEDAEVELYFANYMTIAKFGIDVSFVDDSGTFSAAAISGDYQDRTMIEQNIIVPTANYDVITNLNNRVESILRGSLRLVSSDSVVEFRDDGNGNFLTLGGAEAGGRINYLTGEIILPIPMAHGEYQFIFKQNDLNSISVNESSAIQLIKPKQSYSDPEETLSKIVVV